MPSSISSVRRKIRSHARRCRLQLAPEPDLDAALNLALELMAIRGGSGHEAAVAAYITDRLKAAGARPADIRHDKAHLRTRLKGEVGNLIFTLAGTARSPRRLLMAHMDTVPVCIGSQPKRAGNFVRSADPATGLGADDRAGLAVVLSAAIEILRRGLPHPPLTFFWPIQEEVGLYGARYADLKLLGQPKLAFNWDGGAAEKVTIGATGGYRMDIEVTGLASHAGTAPEKGISAIAIASLAIADLMRGGWHGLVTRGKLRGTSNVGVIKGGDATNVVTDRVHLRRSAQPQPGVSWPHHQGHREGISRRRAGGEKRRREIRPRDIRRTSRLRGLSSRRRRAVRGRNRGGAPRPRRRTRARRQQRRLGRQLDDRPRSPHRDARLRPNERSHHERAARHQSIPSRLPRRPAAGNPDVISLSRGRVSPSRVRWDEPDARSCRSRAPAPPIVPQWVPCPRAAVGMPCSPRSCTSTSYYVLRACIPAPFRQPDSSLIPYVWGHSISSFKPCCTLQAQQKRAGSARNRPLNLLL